MKGLVLLGVLFVGYLLSAVVVLWWEAKGEIGGLASVNKPEGLASRAPTLVGEKGR